MTPFELTIVLSREPTWGTRYELDFGRILSDSSADGRSADDAKAGSDDDERDPDAPSFSLLTGKYRTVTRYHGTFISTSLPYTEAYLLSDMDTTRDDEASQELVVRSEGTVATLKDSAAGAFLQTRHWKGLEVRSGMDAPSVLEQGRGGIARGYGELPEDGKEERAASAHS